MSGTAPATTKNPRVTLDSPGKRIFFTLMSSATLIQELESVSEETRKEVFDFLMFLKSRKSSDPASSESLLPLAQTAWAADWCSPEEDEAWKDL